MNFSTLIYYFMNALFKVEIDNSPPKLRRGLFPLKSILKVKKQKLAFYIQPEYKTYWVSPLTQTARWTGAVRRP